MIVGMNDVDKFFRALVERRKAHPEENTTSELVADDANLPHSDRVLREVPLNLIDRGIMLGYRQGDWNGWGSLRLPDEQ